MTTNSQLSITEPKKQKHTKQTTRIGTESQKWRSHGELSLGWGKEENGRKVTGNKKHKQQVKNRQGKIRNSIGNEEAKELICMTHEHELRGGVRMLVGEGLQVEGNKWEKKWDNCNSIIIKTYLKSKNKLLS